MDDEAVHIILDEVVSGLPNATPSDELDVTGDLMMPDAMRFEVAVRALEHYAECFDEADCTYLPCVRLRLFARHVPMCILGDDCAVFKRILILVCHHAIKCTEDLMCSVPYCESAKEWISRHLIMERLRPARGCPTERRQLLMSDIIQRVCEAAVRKRRRG